MSLLIENNKIEIHRGDKGIIPIQIPLNDDETEFYEFKINDVVTFAVYEEDGYDKCAVILKEKVIEEPTSICKIELTSEDTKIGEILNESSTYWYEVTLNNEETILGFEEDTGAKIFLLLPEGSNEKCL